MTYQVHNNQSAKHRFVLFTLNSLEIKFAIHFFMSRFWALASIWVVFLTSQGISLIEVALITTAYSLSIAVFEIPTGFIADRFGRKVSIVLAYLSQFLGIFIFAFSQETWQFILGFSIWGIGMTMNSGAEQAWLYDETKANPMYENLHDTRYQEVYGLMVSISFLSSTLAYFAGGLLAEYSLRLPIVLTAVVFLFSGIWLTTVPESDVGQIKQKGESSSTLEALSVLKRPEIAFLSVISMIVGGIITSAIYWIQPYFDNSHVSLSLIGLIGSLGVLAASFGASLSKRMADKLGHKTMMGIISVMALSFLFMAITPVLVVLILFLFIRGLRGAFNPYLSTLLNREFPSHIRATALSLVTALSTFCIMLTELGSAFLIEHYSFSVFYGASALLLLSLGLPVAILYYLKKSIN